MSDIIAQLKEHLKDGKDWEKMDTPVAGVSVVKVPATKTRPALLFLEVNPLRSDGKPMKRKGLFIGSKEMYLAFKEALDDDKIFTILQNIEKVNPEMNETGVSKKLEM
ncbi:MAG: hypothetical protein JSV62_05990 [Promethearchaeota archaeon]|nr:MAG: hypothetical protein JSV62_05990 [Candidatus Lokiarchaeota archaeon]